MANARRFALALLGLLVIGSLLPLLPTTAAAQNDGGAGVDAGNTFEAATRVTAAGRYSGRLDAAGGDTNDFYKFFVAAGSPIDIDVNAGLTTGALQVGDSPERLGVRLYDPNGILIDNPNSNVGDARVTFPSAIVAGDYRLELTSTFLRVSTYSFCFVVTGATCATLGLQPIGLGTPLATTHAEVLLVPPAHGNVFGGETPLDYLDASLRGIRQWGPVFERFAADYPQYSYLTQLTVNVELFDGAPQRAGYDVVIIWSPYTGPIFRGLAVTAVGPGPLYTALCGTGRCSTWATLEPIVHDSDRLIILSSFGAAPRAGQVMPDYPEINDVENVMMHEFAHTWGMGHSQTFTTSYRADLMNSPYTDVFGDGSMTGDGGERTSLYCISSLDLYGMARLYEWVGRGVPYAQRQVAAWASLPGNIPYKLYC